MECSRIFLIEISFPYYINSSNLIVHAFDCINRNLRDIAWSHEEMAKNLLEDILKPCVSDKISDNEKVLICDLINGKCDKKTENSKIV